jgi:hypothetical protein
VKTLLEVGGEVRLGNALDVLVVFEEERGGEGEVSFPKEENKNEKNAQKR